MFIRHWSEAARRLGFDDDVRPVERGDGSDLNFTAKGINPQRQVTVGDFTFQLLPVMLARMR